MKCPSCKDGNMQMNHIKNHKVKIAGVAGVIPIAEIALCDTCAESVVSAKEFKRWEKIIIGETK